MAAETRRGSLETVREQTEQLALRYLSRRDRTRAQMRAYLIRMGASPARVRTVLKKFASLGYLNDTAYALKWGASRLAHRPMGRERLAAELSGQGIDVETAVAALDHLYEECSETDLARRFLTRRSPNAALLRRHGFSEDTIEVVLGRAIDSDSAL